MSDFFESDIVKDELKSISSLQQKVYQSAFSFDSMNREEKWEHIELLTTLLDKQRVMFTRLSLTDDPQAKKMTEDLKKSVTALGFPAGTDISVLFSGMEKTIEKFKSLVEPLD
tara:strand:+ start:249 stop:587 length:339 start_codon:yes stop_codon:yes gene_type:complete